MRWEETAKGGREKAVLGKVSVGVCHREEGCKEAKHNGIPVSAVASRHYSDINSKERERF